MQTIQINGRDRSAFYKLLVVDTLYFLFNIIYGRLHCFRRTKLSITNHIRYTTETKFLSAFSRGHGILKINFFLIYDQF
jgi:hypothetical protein